MLLTAGRMVLGSISKECRTEQNNFNDLKHSYLTSTPRTVDSGWASAKSVAQIPVG